LTKVTSIKIEGTVVCLSFAVNMARLGNINAGKCIGFSFMPRLKCTKPIIVLSLGKSFSKVVSGEV